MVRGGHVVSLDAMRMKLILHFSNDIFRQGAGPAHDPGKLHIGLLIDVGAGVNQSIAVVVSGKHPVRTGTRI